MPPDARVQHLLRRAGFGATAAEAAAFSQRGFVATLDALVDYHRTPDDVDALIGQAGYAAVTPSAGGMEPFSPATSINDARQRWLFRMVHTRRPLQEKMALFWHQHFATAYSKIANAVGGAAATQMMAAKRSEHPAGLRGQLELFRDYALPNFRDLLVEVAKDPGDAVLARWPPEHESAPAGKLRARSDGAVHDRRRPVHRERRLRRRARVHRLEPAAHRRRARSAAASISSSTTPRSTTRTRRRSASRSTPTARRRFPRARRRAGMQDGLDLLAALARHPETGAAAGAEAVVVFHQRDSAARRARSSPASRTCTRAATATWRRSCARCCRRRSSTRRDSYFARYSWPVEFVARALKEVGYAGFHAQQRARPAVEHGAAAVRAAGRGRMGARPGVVHDRGDARADEFRVDADVAAAQRHRGGRRRATARRQRRCCRSISTG